MKKLTMTVVLILVCALVFPVSAQKLGLNSVKPMAGVVMPESPWGTGFIIGVGADMGELTRDITLNPFVSYWSSGYDEFGVDLALSNFQIGADVHYHIKDVKGLYAGGGLSFNILSIEFPYFNFITGEQTTESESETKIGFGVLGGYMFPLGNMDAFVQGKYNIISELNTLELTFGIAFDMH